MTKNCIGNFERAGEFCGRDKCNEWSFDSLEYIFVELLLIFCKFEEDFDGLKYDRNAGLLESFIKKVHDIEHFLLRFRSIVEGQLEDSYLT